MPYPVTYGDSSFWTWPLGGSGVEFYYYHCLKNFPSVALLCWLFPHSSQQKQLPDNAQWPLIMVTEILSTADQLLMERD
jgi:hypothetical protein